MVRTGSATRQKLIDAAHALIWANSYAHVSVEDICREAGVQKGSFYHFFPTKHDLASAALEDHWEITKPKLDAIFEEHATATDQLRALCREVLLKQKNALESSGMVCGCPYATVGIEMRGNDELLFALSVSMTKRFLGYFERLLKTGVKEGRIPARGLKQRAMQMHIYVTGAMMQARITNTLDSVGPLLVDALLHISGLGIPPVPHKPKAKKTAAH